MAAKVAVYQIAGHRRSRIVCEAMSKGIRKVGDKVEVIYEGLYREPDHDVAVFYGLEGNLSRVMKEYPQAGKAAAYIDLGYWGRHEGGRWNGFHKIAVNGRHPTDYFQAFPHDDLRLRRFGLVFAAWRNRGTHILLAGMGDKGALAEGYQPEQWERETIAKIREVTDRPILYRPKPSWKSATPIEGTSFSPRSLDISTALADCHAIVTHHSNVGVDGLVAGIPVFSEQGVASVMADRDLAAIESPWRPDGRRQWAAHVSYTQFSIAEMAAGIPWRHLKDEGIIL